MATTAGTLAHPAESSGIWSWITTVDHKRIGTLYGISAFTFFMWGGVQALLIRTQLAVPEGNVISAHLFNQLFTMHALTMIFLAVMPLGAAFFNFLTPLMIGARDMIFPTLNMLSFWVLVLGALVAFASLFVPLGAAEGGFDVVGVGGFGQVMTGAELDRLDRGGDAGVTG